MYDEVPNTTVRLFSGTLHYEHETKRNYDVEITNHWIKLIIICDKVMEYDYVYDSWLHWQPIYCIRIFTVCGGNMRQKVRR
jgi:hypothetical protein